MVLLMFVHVVPLVDDCQRTTLPVWPLRVNTVLLVGAHTVDAAGVTEPPTLAGVTVTVALAELAVAHVPLCTTARY